MDHGKRLQFKVTCRVFFILDSYDNMTASGWGKVGFAEEQSSFLLQVRLNEVDTDKCNRLYNDVKRSVLSQGVDGDTMICAGGEIGVDTCEGDSGGPLQVKNNYKYSNGKGFRIVGITSFACCIGGLHGVCRPARVCGDVFKLVTNAHLGYCLPEGPEPYICCPYVLTAHNRNPLYSFMQNVEQNIILPKETISSAKPNEDPFPVSVQRPIGSLISTKGPMSSTMKYDELKSSLSEDVPLSKELNKGPSSINAQINIVSSTSTENPMNSTTQNGMESLEPKEMPPPIIDEDPSSVSVKKCGEYYSPAEFVISAVGGTKSLPKQFPHMALIGFGPEGDKQWLCGGSLISYNFVLTAAHCLQSTDYGEAKWVHLGDLDISTDEDDAEPQDFKIIKAIAHPNYSSSSTYHDIALLQLDRNVVLTEYVGIACLQTVKTIYDSYDNMTATGWGKVGFAEEQSSFLIKVRLNEVDTETCNRLYSDVKKSVLPQGVDGDTMICAGGEIGVDTCEGDSGGPLQVKNNYKYSNGKGFRIVGITSFGKACGITRSPSIYTRVSYYVDWIESIVWPDEYKMAHP
ncbi:unnamed protein product [Diabrotica balteata]|uniref:Peptidase S1 domain-containing protein n=1 Tax=Diabrotica balteata TaxID=107213 RepID=A0A9N9SY95_DIABA|nr:unnamed protein product [Diabrotica balteata]